MTREQLLEVLRLHGMWRRGEAGGVRADLSDADLRGANLRDAYLRDADLRGADLRGADLSDADLRGADLSGATGLLDAVEYLAQNFERTGEGYVVYKTFAGTYAPPGNWTIVPGGTISEVCNPSRVDTCGCGINVAPLAWVQAEYSGTVYRLLIRWEWLPGVVVPYNTDGKIRCSRAEIVGVVE